MKRPVESLQDFKARIAAIVGDKTEHIAGAPRPHPLLVRKEASDQNAETSLTMTAIKFVHEYEVRLRNDHRGVDLISDVLRFGRLWYGQR